MFYISSLSALFPLFSSTSPPRDDECRSAFTSSSKLRGTAPQAPPPPPAVTSTNVKKRKVVQCANCSYGGNVGDTSGADDETVGTPFAADMTVASPSTSVRARAGGNVTAHREKRRRNSYEVFTERMDGTHHRELDDEFLAEKDPHRALHIKRIKKRCGRVLYKIIPQMEFSQWWRRGYIKGRRQWDVYRSIMLDPSDLVSRRVALFWDGDQQWYEGVLESFDHNTRRYFLFYDDKEFEYVDLSKEKVKFIPEHGEPVINGRVEKKKGLSNLLTPQGLFICKQTIRRLARKKFLHNSPIAVRIASRYQAEL